jgi:3',5'-cyclic-AMP phosphodiesterase
MKIAHISDLHLNTFFKNSNLKSIKRLLKYLIQVNVDHIVITGDLTDNADPKDFEILRNHFRSLGLLRSDRLSVVIGNHDIFGGLQTPEDIFIFPERCRCVDCEKSIQEFSDYFSESFNDSSFGNTNNKFPFLKEINDVQIIELNSIAKYSKVNNPFASNGKITKEDLLETENLLKNHSSSNVVRIVLVHHHFNKIKLKEYSLTSGFWQKIEKQTMKLKKKKRVISFFKEKNIDLVLHGHWHENTEYIRDGVRFFNGGATIKGNISDEIQVNSINVESNSITTETHKLIANSPIIIHRNIQFRNEKLVEVEDKIKIAVNY